VTEDWKSVVMCQPNTAVHGVQPHPITMILKRDAGTEMINGLWKQWTGHEIELYA